jgi:hypothetical protein
MTRFVRTAVWAAVLSTVGASVAYSATTDIVAFSRLGERMLVALGGGLSLWMGYRLFQSANRSLTPPGGLSASTEGNVERANASGFEGNVGSLLSVKMWDVGPGIFFALFGAGLLAYVLFSQVELSVLLPATPAQTVPSPPQPPLVPQVIMKFNFPGLSAQESADKAKVLVRAIRTIDDYLSGAGSKGRADTAILNLKESTRFIVDLGFGDGAYNTYSKLKQMTPAEIERETKETRELYQKVNDALNGGV